MVRLVSHTMLTNKYNQMILITKEVEQAVRESGIKNGVVNVVSKHTTTGVLVNESLECLESDINEFLQRLVPEDHPYAHARMLKDYGYWESLPHVNCRRRNRKRRGSGDLLL